MPQRNAPKMDRIKRLLRLLFSAPPGLAFLPAICLTAFWFGGEAALMIVAIILPLIFIIGGTATNHAQVPADTIISVFDKSLFVDLHRDIHAKALETGRHSATLAVTVDDFEQLSKRYGTAAMDAVSDQIGERLISTMRGADHVGQLDRATFAIVMAPVRQLDLESCIQLAGRLQSAVEDPISVDGVGIYVSASIGFCQSARAPGQTSETWLQAAITALEEAVQRGPSSIRAYSEQMRRNGKTNTALRDEVGQALDGGQIQPWFQPQISTDTGMISGFEALARWSHPARGMISPAEFLPVIERAGLLERLAEVMMYQSFAAIRAWEDAGLHIPQIGVNFAGPELSNPKLLEKIQWELDRFDLTPDRLAVEVLETVVARAPDDVITRNINALGELGCRIDLDDFGTGHASISSIRRFSVSRIKIDRSFVSKADRDPEQQRMISAILTMAERLGVETLAEGVETVGEHVLLAQLGCDHVQGYGIARPMPFEQTIEWIKEHNTKLTDVPQMLDGRPR